MFLMEPKKKNFLLSSLQVVNTERIYEDVLT